MDRLSEEQRIAVRDLIDIVQIEESHAIRLLSESSWVLEHAINAALAGDSAWGDELPGNQRVGAPAVAPSIAAAGANGFEEPEAAAEDGEDEHATLLGSSQIGNSGGASAEPAAPTAGLLSAIERLPGGFLITSPLRALGGSLAYLFSGTSAEVVEQAAAEKFVRSFEKDYGEDHPRFAQVAYRTAVAQAAAEHRLLVAYLHSDDHESSPSFCRNVLCSGGVVALLSDSFSVWGGSIHYRDAAIVSQQVRVSCYPCILILSCEPGGVAVVMKIEGTVSSEELCNLLGVALASTNDSRERSQRARQRKWLFGWLDGGSDEAARLREEQDRDFLAAQEADWRREADAANAARVAAAAEAEAAAAAAAAEAARVARDAAAAAEMMRWTEALAQKRSALEPEPAVSAPGSAGGGVVRLRLQFPDGSRKDRRFRAQSTIQDVRNFVDVVLADSGGCGLCYPPAIPPNFDSVEATQCPQPPVFKEYELATNFPRKTFSDGSATLQDAGLLPQAMLYVQSL